MLTAFFAAGLTMLAAAALAAIVFAATDEQRWHWLALHLALLGGVSQLILGAAQFFVCAFLATDRHRVRPCAHSSRSGTRPR